MSDVRANLREARTYQQRSEFLYRRAVVLAHEEGLSYRDIAHELGVSYQTVARIVNAGSGASRTNQ